MESKLLILLILFLFAYVTVSGKIEQRFRLLCDNGERKTMRVVGGSAALDATALRRLNCTVKDIVPHLTKAIVRLNKATIDLEVASNGWTRVVDAERVAFTAIDFDGNVAVAAAELGVVYANYGGKWGEIQNLGFPNYFEGVHLTEINGANGYFLTGFSDKSVHGGIVAWSTFESNKLIMKTVDDGGWLMQCQGNGNGVVLSPTIEGTAFLRATPTAAAFQWKIIQNTGGSWFAPSAPFIFNGSRALIAGLQWAVSTDAGASFVRHAPVDADGDSGPAYNGLKSWLVGGGDIMPAVVGWVHASRDNQTTWSPRHSFPYPMRSLGFINSTHAVAGGGNFFSGVGGVWMTRDGGGSWQLVLDTAREMKALSVRRRQGSRLVDVHVAGSNKQSGQIYWQQFQA